MRNRLTKYLPKNPKNLTDIPSSQHNPSDRGSQRADRQSDLSSTQQNWQPSANLALQDFIKKFEQTIHWQRGFTLFKTIGLFISCHKYFKPCKIMV
jgi:hypothetical protein